MKKLTWAAFIVALLALGVYSAHATEPVMIYGASPNATRSAPALTPHKTTSAAATLLLKASEGYLFSAYATNLTATAGFLVVYNAVAVPADGALTGSLVLDCAPLPANGIASINYRPGPAANYDTGIVAFVTSATTCYTKTTGVITAFIKGDVQ